MIQRFAIEYDDAVIRALNIRQLSNGMWQCDLSRRYDLRDKFGQILGDVWAHAFGETAEEAFAASWLQLLSKTEDKLAERNARSAPAVTKPLSAFAGETLKTTKSAGDLGL